MFVLAWWNIQHIPHIGWMVLPLGRSWQRDWISFARCWLDFLVPCGKAQMLRGTKWSETTRNVMAKQTVLTLKQNERIMHSKSSSHGIANQCYSTYILTDNLASNLLCVGVPLTPLGHMVGSNTLSCKREGPLHPWWASQGSLSFFSQ